MPRLTYYDNIISRLSELLSRVPNLVKLDNHSIFALLEFRGTLFSENESRLLFPNQFFENIVSEIVNKKGAKTFMFLNTYFVCPETKLLDIHTSALIFEFKRKILRIERYSPNNEFDFLDSCLYNVFKRIFGYKNIEIKYYCPGIFCTKRTKRSVTRTVMYVYDRIINPNLSRKEIARLSIYLHESKSQLSKRVHDFRRFLLTNDCQVPMKFKGHEVIECLGNDYNMVRF